MNDITPTPLADLLKRATAENHAQAESRPFQRALVGGAAPRTALAAHQQGMLELIRAIRSRLPEDGRWTALRSAMAAHAARLERDLAGLRNGEAAPPPSAAVTAFVERLGGKAWPPAAALGAFYVVEGSMNGNRFIRRALAATRPDLAENLRYFDPYGSAQRERWLEFRSKISRIGAALDAPDEAVRAARATFEAAVALAAEAEVRMGRAA